MVFSYLCPVITLLVTMLQGHYTQLIEEYFPFVIAISVARSGLKSHYTPGMIILVHTYLFSFLKPYHLSLPRVSTILHESYKFKGVFVMAC